MEKFTEIEKIVNEAKEEAKEKLKHIMTEKMLAYEYYLNLETKRILKEKYNIEWTPPDDESPYINVD